MLKKKEFWIATFVTIFTAMSTFYLAYTIFNNKDINQNPINDSESKIYALGENTESQIEATRKKIGETEAAILNMERITPSTKLVYEYYYKGDGEIKREVEVPPYFLIDMSRQDIEEKFPDWQLTSFSNSEVVMRKNIEGNSRERYIIGEYEGYVAVFFEEPVDGVILRELTDTPISSLTEEDQKKLKIGISILGDDELIKALENYES